MSCRRSWPTGTIRSAMKGLLVAAAAASLDLWIAGVRVVARCKRRRRPRAGPATMDLGPEPPAVVNFLVNDLMVTPDAVPATLLDLAARRFLSVEQVAPAHTIVRLNVENPPRAVLQPYEQ